MSQKPKRQFTTVREHLLHVSISPKNPTGITIVDRHLRRLPGPYLDTAEITEAFKYYSRKILRRGKIIYFGAMGTLDNPRTKEGLIYTFPKHGTYYYNGRSHQFMVVANEHGDCYNIYRGDEKPCPQGEFPIHKKK